MGIPPSEERLKEAVIYIRQFFWVFVLLQASYLVSFSTADAPISQDGSRSEGFWQEQGSLWPGMSPGKVL